MMLQENDVNFRALVYELTEGVYVCDFEGKFIYANLALANIFGFERPGLIIGRHFKEFFSPEHVNQFMDQFRKSTESRTNSTFITGEINRQDGTTAIIEIHAMPFIKDKILLGNKGEVRDITGNTGEENKMIFNATHDALTGIYNRTFFDAEMKRLERGRQYPISMIVVVVDLMKAGSDRKEHELWGKFIKKAAYQLFYSLRGDDILARTAEDEFVILVPSVDEKAVEVITERTQANLLKIADSKGEPVLECYIGAGTADKGKKLEAVWKQAQEIAYLKKKQNKIT